MADNSMSMTEAAIKGAIAGVIGGAALMLMEQLEHVLLLPRGDTTGTMGQQAVDAVAKSRGVELSKPASQIAGAAGQLAYCALLGAISGIAKRSSTRPAVVEGLATAGLAYAGSMSAGGLLPKLGATAPPTGHSMEEAAVPVAAYLAFGLTTAAVLDATI
jgi:hypothetical protein